MIKGQGGKKTRGGIGKKSLKREGARARCREECGLVMSFSEVVFVRDPAPRSTGASRVQGSNDRWPVLPCAMVEEKHDPSSNGVGLHGPKSPEAGGVLHFPRV